MNLPRIRLSSLPLRRKLLLVVPALLALAGVGVALALTVGSSGGSSGHTALEAVAAPSATPEPTEEPSPTPEPTPAYRTDCDAIRGTPYQSDEERAWYVQNCPSSDSTAAAQAQSVGGGIAGSGDRLVIRSIGVNAPVNVRKVGSDGVMGNPQGPDDVVWYDFSALPGLGGYPGTGGNAAIAGHVDWGVQHSGLGCKNNTVPPPCGAVFWTLRSIQTGASIDYITADGRDIQYSVDWVKNLSGNTDFVDYVTSTGSDVITLITCEGTFNPATHEYDQRMVVRASRVQ